MFNIPSSPVLVGRDSQIAMLGDFAARVANGDGRALLVRGDAGAGKTRLVRELATEAPRAGTTVLIGGCVAIGGEPLRHAALMELVRAARQDESGSGSVAGLSTEEMLEELLVLVERVRGPDSLVLVVEDLHWADRGTCEILTVLARHVLDRPVGVVMTCRDDELPREHHVRQFLTELLRAQLATPVVASPLSAADVARLVEALVGAVDAVTAATIFDRSGGNALIVEELCAAGPSRVGESLEGPLRDIMLTRFSRLSESAREIVSAVAVAGAAVPQRQLFELLDVDAETMAAALREAIDLHVLAARDDTIWFRHVLMAEAVYGDLLSVERVRLHSRWAETLCDPGRDRTSAHGMQDEHATTLLLAHHWYEAGNSERAFDASLLAARAASGALAYDTADRHYQRVLLLWDRVLDPHTRAGCSRVQLGLQAAEVANWAGDPGGAVVAVDSALASPDAPDDAATRSVLRERRAWYLLRQGENTAAREAYEHALASLPDDTDAATRARVLAGSVRAWERAHDYERALAMARDAVDIAVDEGAAAEVGQARYMLGRILLNIGEVEAAVDELERSAIAAEAVLNPVSLVIALLERADGLARRGRLPEGVDAALAVAQRLEDRGHEDPQALLALAAAAALQHRLGRPTAGRELAGRIVGAARASVTLAIGHLLAGTFDIEAMMLTSAREHLETGRFLAAPLLDGRVAAALASARAELALAEGNIDGAANALEEGIEKVVYSGDDEALAHLCLHGLRVQAERDLLAFGRSSERAQSRRARAIAVYEGHLQRVLDAPPPGAHRPDLDAVGAAWAAERTRLDGATDPDAWEHSDRSWEAVQWPRWAVYAALRRADALARSNAPTPAVSDALDAVQRRAVALESPLLIAQVTHLAGRLGLGLAGGGPATDGAPAPAGGAMAELTRREREVLDLVAAGATNRQIASRLFISEKTASVHVSRILTKLGAANRQEAAALARRNVRRR